MYISELTISLNTIMLIIGDITIKIIGPSVAINGIPTEIGDIKNYLSLSQEIKTITYNISHKKILIETQTNNVSLIGKTVEANDPSNLLQYSGIVSATNLPVHKLL